MSNIPPKLADLILKVWDEGVAMRAAGATKEAMQEHWRDRLLTYAHNAGLVTREEDLPSHQLARCPICHDDGWAPTTRYVRGEYIEAYRRCSCKPEGISTRETDQAKAVEKVASGWNRTMRK